MRSLKAAVFAGVLAATASVCPGPIGAVAAQEVSPPEAAASALPSLGRERITLEILGLEPAGEPVVSGITEKGDPILSAPFRLREEGRLAADIATQGYRMAAGVPVVHREFKPQGTDASEAIQAWCGPGETRTMFGWSGGSTVCMVHTADGKANLGAPQLSFGPWWMSTNVAFISPDARAERVAVEPAQTPSTFSLIFVYERLRPEGVALHPTIEGPGLSADARPYRYDMARRVLPVVNGVAELTYDGLKVSLTPERRGDVLVATSERVAPSFDIAALRARIEATNRPSSRTPDGSPEDKATAEAEAVEPTPFVIGGIRLDPTALTVGPGVLERGEIALSGQATYAVTTQLQNPVNFSATFVNDTAPAGLILHRVEFANRSPLGSRTMTRIWCGPIAKPTLFSGNERITMCLRRGMFGGWEAFWPATGRPWLGTTLQLGVVATLQATGFAPEPSPTSLLEPLSVRAEIQRVTDDAVTLRLFARREDEDALILTVTPKFENDVAVLPLWTHRLALTRSGNGVTASLSGDGDGQGPTDDGFYP